MTPMQVQPKEGVRSDQAAQQQKMIKLQGSKSETPPKPPVGMMYGHMVGFN